MDADCPGNSICYVNVTWNDPSIPIPVCACSNRYMSEGNDCNQMTPFSIYLTISCSVQILFCLALVCVIIYDLYLMVRYNEHSISIRNSTTAVFLFSGLSLISIASMKAWEIYSYTYGMQNMEYYFDPVKGYRKYSPLAKFQNYASCFIAMFGTLATLNVSLLWATVAGSTAKLHNRYSKQSLSKKYQIFIYVVDFIFTVVMFAITLAGNTYSMFIAVIFTIVIGASYLFGYFKLRKVMLNSISSNVSQIIQIELKAVLNRIYFCALSLSSLSFLFVLFALIYSRTQLSGGNRYTEKPNITFSMNQFSWEIALWILTIMIAMIVNFIHPDTHRLVLRRMAMQQLGNLHVEQEISGMAYNRLASVSSERFVPGGNGNQVTSVPDIPTTKYASANDHESIGKYLPNSNGRVAPPT